MLSDYFTFYQLDTCMPMGSETIMVVLFLCNDLLIFPKTGGSWNLLRLVPGVAYTTDLSSRARADPSRTISRLLAFLVDPTII